jgi:hypothetical protein
LILIRGGYPPISVRPEDRKRYLDALERGSVTNDLGPFHHFMYERLDATLEEYLSALEQALPGSAGSPTSKSKDGRQKP